MMTMYAFAATLAQPRKVRMIHVSRPHTATVPSFDSHKVIGARAFDTTPMASNGDWIACMHIVARSPFLNPVPKSPQIP